MSRPIAYNASGPLSGSIRGGNVNYTVDSGNRDYTTFASKKWVPSADGAAPIVFVTDTYTQGFELNPSLAVPLFYSCNGTGSAAIIYTANRIPGSPGNYSDANVALNDLINARGYFILESNDPYQGDYQSGDLLMLDASKMSSYPQVGTNWLDLSGNDFDFSLQNGPTFNSNGWFGMDGADDSIYLSGNSTLKSTNTLVMWMRTTDTTGLPLSGQPPYTGGGYYVGAYYPGQGFYNANAGSPDFFLDTLATSNPATPVNYLDGRFHMWEAKGLNFTTWTTNWNFLAYGGGFEIVGDIAKIKMFDSYLTAAQSKQLYFGAPIVTDGLVFAVDANNIVSYPKSGTTWYRLTGSVDCSLLNGPTFNPANGGSIVFDGTDDYGNLSANAENILTTVSGEAWVKILGPAQVANYHVVFQKEGGYSGGSVYGIRLQESGGITVMQAMIYYSAVSSEFISLNGTTNLNDGNWHHVAFTYDSSYNLRVFVDGEQENIATGTNVPFQNSSNIQVALGDSRRFNGALANFRIYNRALSASEVLQNYQAEQYRFETPAGPVTNGLVLYWDAGNLDSYPGTGSTIYDLSGNGNNGTLYNGVGYNQTNGGVLTFDGVDDYVISYNPNLSTTTSTVMGAARYSGATRGRMINSTDVNWLMGHWGNTTENYYAEGWVSTPGSGPSDTNWRIYAALGNQPSDAWALYVNNTVTATSTDGSSGPDGISIGAQTYGGTSEFSTGQFSFVLVYNRVLTTAEMTQNYNYFKGRFGL
jgi:hypothetical protein